MLVANFISVMSSSVLSGVQNKTKCDHKYKLVTRHTPNL